MGLFKVPPDQSVMIPTLRTSPGISGKLTRPQELQKEGERAE